MIYSSSKMNNDLYLMDYAWDYSSCVHLGLVES